VLLPWSRVHYTALANPELAPPGHFWALPAGGSPQRQRDQRTAAVRAVLADGRSAPATTTATWRRYGVGSHRFGGILHVVKAVSTPGLRWEHPITGDTVAAAIRLAREYLIPHYIAIPDVPRPNSRPLFITTGFDGNLWFTEATGNRIGRLNLGCL